MGLGISEIAILLIVALLVIGPDKLPDMAKSIGKGYGEFKRAFGDIKKSVDITGDFTKNSSTSTKAHAQTYKSRWEEAQTPQEPTVAQAAETAPTEEAAKEEAPVRAKRGDLIQGDD
jgi:TatA/E family protein of Tat protein translocase